QQTTSPGQKPANPTDRVPTLRGLSGDRLGSRTPNSPRNQRSDAHKLRKSGDRNVVTLPGEGRLGLAVAAQRLRDRRSRPTDRGARFASVRGGRGGGCAGP